MRSCSNKGYPIPIYDAGTGACSGAEYNTTSFLTTNAYETERIAPGKTLHEWLSDLHKDGFLLTSFVFGLISGKLLHLLGSACKSICHVWSHNCRGPV